MAHFHGICHGNCDLKYIGLILEFRKLDFRGLIRQFNVKMANFRGLIGKIGHLKPILASITHQFPIFMNYVMENVPKKYAGGILKLKSRILGVPEAFAMPKG